MLQVHFTIIAHRSEYISYTIPKIQKYFLKEHIRFSSVKNKSFWFKINIQPLEGLKPSVTY